LPFSLNDLTQILKKNTAILLFICLFVPFLGTYTWLQYQKHQTKEMVKRQILAHADKKELVTLIFSTAETTTELHWEHDSEFEYKGQMYDIVETQTHGDSISYICWWDHQETALNLQLQQIVEKTFGDDPQNHKKQDALKDYYKSLYFAPLRAHDFSSHVFYFHNLKSSFFYKKSLYLPFYNTPLSPPPEIVS
jgi:hypothetical protein